ncbi:MAG: hypothetical protein ACREOI_25515 [bacterium]
MKRKLKVSTIEKFSEVLVHLGEASIVGGGATLFVQGLVSWIESLAGIVGGIFLVLWGLYIHNKYGE